ncbi:MAG: hypothetical protein ACK5IM_04260 [Demequina sp.]|uniref:hypothetical protein n=1 Tax=Demequina sp. TaxID=2050685 RepID=UPI003A83F1CF
MRLTAVVVLVVLGIGGLVGGVSFLADPSGAGLGLDGTPLPGWLAGDYLLPGLALVSVFGVAPLVTAVTVQRRWRHAWMWTAALGLALLTWMAVQVAIIGWAAPPMQGTFTLIGAWLAWVGVSRARRQSASER